MITKVKINIEYFLYFINIKNTKYSVVVAAMVVLVEEAARRNTPVPGKNSTQYHSYKVQFLTNYLIGHPVVEVVTPVEMDQSTKLLVEEVAPFAPTKMRTRNLVGTMKENALFDTLVNEKLSNLVLFGK